MSDRDVTSHHIVEDVVAVITGTAIVALGIALYAKTTLLTGGTTGLALLLQYATGLPFAVLLFVVNLPFYGLSALRMGWKLTIRTFLAVGLLTLFAWLTPSWLTFSSVNPLFASVMGGVLIGVGMLILFRHRTSLGGVNLLALYAQDRFGLRAGYVQLGIDAAIIATSLLVIPLDRVGLSLVGTTVLNLVLATNHRPGRYTGVS